MEEEPILDSAMIDELWGTVSEELVELAEGMESALLTLEKSPQDTTVINGLFRALHTYKSSSGMMGCNVTEALAHRGEDLIDYYRGQEQSLPAEVIELMFETIDLLATLRDHVSEYRSDAPASVTRELIDKLTAAHQAAGGEVVVSAQIEEFDGASLGLDPEEFAELWETVSEEMRELLDEIEESLLQLEQRPTDGPLFGRLFRAMHTFKSSAGMMALMVMEQIAHHSEDLVRLLQDQGLPLDEQNASLLLAALDQLRQLHDHADHHHHEGDGAAARPLIEQLRTACSKIESSPVAEGTTPPVAATATGDENDSEEAFGFFDPEPPEEEEEGFGFFDMASDEEEEEEEEGFGFFEDDSQGIWELTVAECGDNLDEIEDALLQLEQHGEQMDQVDRLFRAIHTIKGTANVMGLMRIEALSHRAEDVVGLVRDRLLAVSPALVSLLLEVMDLTRVGLDGVREKSADLDPDQIKPLVGKLTRVLENPAVLEQEGGKSEEDTTPPVPQGDDETALSEEEQESPANDPLYLKIFIEMGWEALERLNGLLEQLAADGGEESLQQLRQELEELAFAAERMGFAEMVSRIGPMMTEVDPMVLVEQLGWFGGEITRQEDRLQALEAETVPADAAPAVVPLPTTESLELEASDDDFFGGVDAFDEVAGELPPLPPEAALLEPDVGEDQVDPVFTPVFVQDFLEKEEGQLIGIREIWDRPVPVRERIDQIVRLLAEIEQDARKMGYDHLIEIIEGGRQGLKGSRGEEEVEEALYRLELNLYEEMTAIQEAVPDLTRTSAGEPLDISWVFRQSHAERVYEELTELNYLLDIYEVMQSNPKLDRVPEMDEVAETHMRSIHHAALFHELTAAAGLALSLADCYTRIVLFEFNTLASLFTLTREFLRELGGAIDGICDGQMLAEDQFDGLMGQVEDLLYMNSGSKLIKSARDVLSLLDLPEDFFEVFTPDSLHAVGEALEKGYHFYIIHTDMDQNEEVALGFYRWSQQDAIEIITNFTVLKEGRSLFDFLVASPLGAQEIHEQLLEIDAGGRLLRLRKSALRSDIEEGTLREEHEVASGRRFSSNNTLSTEELMEMVGDLVSVQSMLHHVTSSLSGADLLAVIDQEMARGGDWRTAREQLKGELESWKRHHTVLGQLESEVGAAVVRLQELVHTTDAVPFEQLLDGMDGWVAEEAAAQKKSVHLELINGHLEVDRKLLERLQHPLEGLLKAAIDGVEPVVQRMEAGKSSIAEIRLTALKSHDLLELVIQCDGGGIDHSRLESRHQQWLEEGTEERQEVTTALLQQGFGGLPLAGLERTLDLYALQQQMDAAGGQLRLSISEEMLELRAGIQLSMVVVNGLVVRIGAVRYVIPVNLVRRIVQVQREQIVHTSADGGREMLHLGESLIPLKLLAGMELSARSRLLMVVVDVGDRGEQLACPVDELIDQQQVMIRPLRGVLRGVQDASGMAVLGDGEVGMVLRLQADG